MGESMLNQAIQYALDKLSLHELQLKPFQKEVISTYSKGQDCFCISLTGSGKSMTFRLAPLVLDYMKGINTGTDFIISKIIIIQHTAVSHESTSCMFKRKWNTNSVCGR